MVQVIEIFPRGKQSFVFMHGIVNTELGQYRCCWCPGDTSRQGISCRGIDLVLPEYSDLSTRARFLSTTLKPKSPLNLPPNDLAVVSPPRQVTGKPNHLAKSQVT